MSDTAVRRSLEAGIIARWRADLARAWAISAVRQGLWGSCLVLVGSLTPAFLPSDNAFAHIRILGQLQHGAGRVLATAVLLFGVFVLVRAWLRLFPSLPGADVSRVTLGLWGLPLIFAPPLFSSDAYSYAAQGSLVRRGYDPYAVGPGLLGGPFADQVDPLWMWTPAPYGPLALQLQHGIVDLMGGNAYASAVGMRLPAIAALVVIAALVPRVATALGRDARLAMWIGVLNPLTVLHLLGGAHNDVVMIAFVVLALWLATQRRLVLASLAVSAAAAVKQPAFIVVVAVGLLCAQHATGGRSGSWTRERLARVGVAAGVAAAGFVVITALTGLGYGWVGAMYVPAEVRTYLAPSTAVGVLLEQLLRLTGHAAGAGFAVPVARALGVLVALLLAVRLIVRTAPLRPISALVSTLLVIVACAPSVHPWYFLWGGVLLGLARLDRRRLRVATWLTALFASYGAIDFAVHNGLVAFGVTACLALLWVATGHDRELIHLDEAGSSDDRLLVIRASLPPALLVRRGRVTIRPPEGIAVAGTAVAPSGGRNGPSWPPP